MIRSLGQQIDPARILNLANALQNDQVRLICMLNIIHIYNRYRKS